MPGRFSLTVVVVIAACAWALALIVDGKPVEGSFFTPASTVVSVLVVLGLLFDRWGWACWGVRSIWHRPDLRGTWKGDLRSNFPGAEAPIEAYVSIHQTYSSVTVTLFSGESSSKTGVATIETDKDGTDTIAGIYRSESRLALREQNPMHDGAFLLRVEGKDLRGKYWTDRGTRGEATFHRISGEKAVSFPHAQSFRVPGTKRPKRRSAALGQTPADSTTSPSSCPPTKEEE